MESAYATRCCLHARRAACALFALLCAACLALLAGGCTREAVDYTKEMRNLGFLTDKSGELVLLLNTEVNMTTVRSDVRDEVVEQAQEQLESMHVLLDGYRFYTDDAGADIANLAYLNAHFGQGPVAVDQRLFEALDESLVMAQLTEGYFNPTVGRLVDVYEGRFLDVDTVQENPDADDVASALATVVPYQNLQECILLDRDALTVELVPFEGHDFTLSLGAIGKGFALERLSVSPDESYLLSAGESSIVGHVGQLSPDTTWNVAVRTPDAGDVLLAFHLDEGAMSTSGDDQSYYLLSDGTRVHHILNPFTGYSENHYRNVVLVGQDAGVLDALSTALFSIGDAQEAMRIVEAVEQNYGISIECCYIVQDGEGYAVRADEDFQQRLIDEYTSEDVTSIDGIG